MPKIVDHEQKKRIVAEAAWRVIRRDGLEHASVRNIAAEAGLSVGSMRHYFSTQSELLAFSMKLVTDRVKARLHGMAFTGDLVEDILSVLLELVPLDEERRVEMEVWIAFTTKALVDPTLQTLSREVASDMRTGIAGMLKALVKQGKASEELHLFLETERLIALVDGLAMHVIMEPEQVTGETVRSILKRHLHSLLIKSDSSNL